MKKNVSTIIITLLLVSLTGYGQQGPASNPAKPQVCEYLLTYVADTGMHASMTVISRKPEKRLAFIINAGISYRDKFYTNPDSLILGKPGAGVWDSVIVVYSYLLKNFEDNTRIHKSVPYSHNCIDKKKTCKRYQCEFLYLQTNWIASVSTFDDAFINVELFKDPGTNPVKQFCSIISTALCSCK